MNNIKVTCEIHDYSNPAQPAIRVHSHWCYGGEVEIEIKDERYTVDGRELIEAIKKAMNY